MAATGYVLRKAAETGNPAELLRRMRSKSTCKTCALGMGGQRGGMVNEAGHFPEVCKKSVQAQAADMQAPIDEATLSRLSLDDLSGFSSRQFDRLGRLGFPIVARPGASHFARLGWDEAAALAAEGLAAAGPARSFFYASGRSSNEAAWLFQLVGRAFGSGNIHNCSSYCHNASSVALATTYGSGTASVTLDDVAHTDLVLLAGANPASNHPRLMTQLVELRRRGGVVIVINPLRELGLERFRVPSDPQSLLFGSRVSDLYLQPHAGADTAVFIALLKALLERKAIDSTFLADHTTGWEAVRDQAVSADWDDVQARAGLERHEIEAAARLLAAARNGMAMWAMGLTHHADGVGTVTALANLVLARGWLGRPGAGLLPLRGHSNVQGVGSMGVAPHLKLAFAERLAALYGIAPALAESLDTYASMVAASEGRIDAAVLLGGNLFASNPDRAWAAEALNRVDTLVSLTTKLNDGHVVGRGLTTVVLPVLARDEEPGATTQESMFNYVRLSDAGRPLHASEARSEVAIIAALAERLLPAGRIDWGAIGDHRALRVAIAATVPGYEAIGAIDRTHREFQVAGRTFHGTDFGTPDGRAHLSAVDMPAAPEPGSFRLMTIRSEGQFNTVVYDEEDLYRGNAHRNVVMLAAADAARLGIHEGDVVVVTTAVGSLHVEAALVPIRPGNLAMYYPEANAIVPRQLDPRSGTPAFKNIPATLRRT